MESDHTVDWVYIGVGELRLMTLGNQSSSQLNPGANHKWDPPTLMWERIPLQCGRIHPSCGGSSLRHLLCILLSISLSIIPPECGRIQPIWLFDLIWICIRVNKWQYLTNSNILRKAKECIFFFSLSSVLINSENICHWVSWHSHVKYVFMQTFVSFYWRKSQCKSQCKTAHKFNTFRSCRSTATRW